MVGVPNIGENDLALLVFPVKGEMVMRFRFSLLAAAALSVGIIAPAVHADSVLPNTPNLSNPTLVPVLDSISGTYTMKNALLQVVGTGTYTEVAVRDSSTGGVDFLYQFSADASSHDTVDLQSVTDYTGFAPVASGSLSDSAAAALGFSAGTVLPSSIGLNPSGSAVDVTTTLAPGSTSKVIALETLSPSFTLGSINIQDGGNATVIGLSPAAPAPASLWGGAGLLGLMGIFGIRRRRLMA